MGTSAQSLIDRTLNDAKNLLWDGKSIAATDCVVDLMDNLLSSGDFDGASYMLDSLSYMQYSPEILTAVLCVTKPAKDKLSNRGEFCDGVEDALISWWGKDPVLVADRMANLR